MSDTIIDQVRAQYPAAIAQPRRDGEPPGYCVGTAVCRYHGYDVEDFVGEYELAGILAELNPALDGPPEDDNEEGAPAAAWEFASAITARNDEYEIDEAWHLAARALAYTGTEGRP